MNKRLRGSRRFLFAWLAVGVFACVALALAALPAQAQSQPQPPIGIFVNPVVAGSPGGKHTVLNIKEDGTTAIAFFDLQAAQTTVYTGTWSYDPYGTVTLNLVMGADQPCADEDTVTGITFMPSLDSRTLTAIHFPYCLWGDSGITLLAVTDEQQAALDQAYAEAGLMPGAVFETGVIEANDGSQRQYTLNLGAAEQAAWITDDLNGETPLKELGTWTANMYTVTVTLTGTVDTVYEEPEVLAFGFIKDGSGSMAAYEFDVQKYGKQGLELTWQPQLPSLLAAGEAAATEAPIAGIYNSDVLPAADTPGLVQTLALFETGEAQNTLNYLNGEPPTVELGTWDDNEDGTITLVIDSAPEAKSSATVTTTYTVDNQQPVQQLQADNIVLHKLPVVELDGAQSGD